MSIEPGTRLGVFEITQLIGAGGMGEVYRARDTKLGRDVAIKVLSEDFAKDPERLARFEREAQMLAALDHPNIAALYDFRTETIEEYIPPGSAGPPSKGDSREAATESPPSKGDSGGAAAESPPLKGDLGGCKELRFLVMQLIEGETLADRIEKGAIPLEEALPSAFAHDRTFSPPPRSRDVVERSALC